MVTDSSETESQNLKWKKNVCKQDAWYSFTHSCITCFPGNKPNNFHYWDDFFSINRNICIFLFRLSVILETTRWVFIETMDFLTFSQFETKTTYLGTAACMGDFQNKLRISLSASHKQIVIVLCNAAESSSSSSGSHKWVDVSSMSGLSHGNERAGELGSIRRGVIIGLSDHLCSR